MKPQLFSKWQSIKHSEIKLLRSSINTSISSSVLSFHSLFTGILTSNRTTAFVLQCVFVCHSQIKLKQEKMGLSARLLCCLVGFVSWSSGTRPCLGLRLCFRPRPWCGATSRSTWSILMFFLSLGVWRSWPFGSPWDLWRSLRSWGWLRFGWCLFRGRFSQPWRLGAGSSRWAQAVRRIRTLQTTFFYLWVGGICLGTLVLCPLRGLLSTWDVEFDRAKHTLSHSGQLRHDFVHSTLRGSWWRGCSSGSSSSSSCSLSAIVSLLHLLGDASSWCGSNRDIPGHSRSSARIHFTTGFGPGLRSFGGPPGIHWRCGGFDKWVFADRGKGATTSGKGAG